MVVKKNEIGSGLDFLSLGLYAFGGLGLEIILAFLIEPLIYGKSMNDFSTTENILHWIITCIMWAIMSYVLIRVAKKRYGFDMFSYKSSIGIINWFICFGLLVISVFISYISSVVLHKTELEKSIA